MPQTTIGKITFEKSYVDVRVDSEVVVFEAECNPQPAGRQKHYNPVTPVPVRLLRQFLQAAEQGAMIEGATTPGNPPPSLDDLLAQLMQAFNIKQLDIDLTKIPDPWKQVFACYNTSISYQVKYEIWEIIAKAAQATTLGGQDYPQGDTVASFRMEAPCQYRILFRMTYSRDCCPLPEHVIMPPIVHTGEWQPEMPKFKFGLDLDLKYKLDLPLPWYKYRQWKLPESGGGEEGK
jgi:hypothetical protein